MTKFYLTIEASASYVTVAPTLEILVDGVVVDSAVVTIKTGSGTNSFTFLLDYSTGSNFPTSLSVRFNDGSSEAGRSISISDFRVNGQSVDNADLSSNFLLQNQSGILNIANTDHLFGRVEPTQADLGTATITGTAGDDKLEGTIQADIVDGSSGNDYLRGVQGDDAINGGAGDDTIFGEDGNDIVIGGAGNDLIFGNAGDDLLYGQDGNDVIIGASGNDVLNGGAGNDSVMGGAGNDIMFGEAGDDTLVGAAGDDYLYGDDGIDILVGGIGNDTLYGGLGNDTLIGGAGIDTIYGEDNDDFIIGDAGDDNLNGNGGIDFIYGGTGNDTISGGSGNDTLYGDDGNDTITGDTGNDTIVGGAGSDTLNGGDGIDLIYGNGLDSYNISSILDANPNVVFSEETNSFYQFVQTNVTFAGARGVAGSTTLNGVEGHLVTITSQAENDFINNLVGANQIWINATDANNEGQWQWGAGDEDGLTFWNVGAATNGFYTNWNAGEPNDSGGEDAAVMLGSGFWNDLSETATNFYVIEWELGKFSDDNSADTLNGDNGNDILSGYGGNDIYNGGNGSDQIYGGAGNDTLNGDAGDDYIYDAEGSNNFNGGAGNDLLDARFKTAIPSISEQVATLLAENPGLTYSSDTGNFYEVINSQVNWDVARSNAAADLLNGVGGYLATITSSAEHDFIVSISVGNNTWLGGSDDPAITGGNYDEWYWVDGPEAGTQFSVGGTAVGGQYTNWDSTQPNDSDNTQNYLYLLNYNNQWADLVNIADGSTGYVTVPQYLVEWDGSDVLITPPTPPAQSANTMNGGAGSDIIYGGTQNDTINGDGDNDYLYGNDGKDTMDGGTGADIIYGGTGSDNITGGAGNDTLWASGLTKETTVNFPDASSILSYGGSGQDYGGTVTIIEEGTGLSLEGNLWKKTLVNYNVTANTILEFEFKSTGEAEISGIGFDNDDAISSSATFKVYGTQNWGNSVFDNYNGSGNWQSYAIDVGNYCTGTFSYLFFVNDDDAGGVNSTDNSWFRNIRIYEKTDLIDDTSATNTLNGGAGDDVIYGSSGTDSLSGGDGNDIIYSNSEVKIPAYTIADALAENPNVVYNSATGNFYEYVSTATNYNTALSAAKSSTLNGVGGYLTNITSAAEQSYVWGLTGNNSIWGGGSDAAVEGEWRWVSGAENGTQFWSGGPSGSPVGGMYNNWIAGQEPWDLGSSYDYFILRSQNGGQWYTERASRSYDYVIEWDGADILTSGSGGKISTLIGGDGLDKMYGGAGADTFLFEAIYAYNDIDEIYNFDITDKDALDISDILSGYNPATDVITDWVEMTDSGSNTVVKVDTTGTGNFGAGTQIATLFGVTGLTDEVWLEDNGNLITV